MSSPDFCLVVVPANPATKTQARCMALTPHDVHAHFLAHLDAVLDLAADAYRRGQQRLGELQAQSAGDL